MELLEFAETERAVGQSLIEGLDLVRVFLRHLLCQAQKEVAAADIEVVGLDERLVLRVGRADELVAEAGSPGDLEVRGRGLDLAVVEAVREVAEGRGAVQEGEVLPVDVLHHCQAQQVVIRNVPDDRADGLEADGLAGAQAALPYDELIGRLLVVVAGHEADHDGLLEAFILDGLAELKSGLGREILAGLVWVGPDRGDGDLQDALGRSRRCLRGTPWEYCPPIAVVLGMGSGPPCGCALGNRGRPRRRRALADDLLREVLVVHEALTGAVVMLDGLAVVGGLPELAVALDGGL